MIRVPLVDATDWDWSFDLDGLREAYLLAVARLVAPADAPTATIVRAR